MEFLKRIAWTNYTKENRLLVVALGPVRGLETLEEAVKHVRIVAMGGGFERWQKIKKPANGEPEHTPVRPKGYQDLDVDISGYNFGFVCVLFNNVKGGSGRDTGIVRRVDPTRGIHDCSSVGRSPLQTGPEVK